MQLFALFSSYNDEKFKERKGFVKLFLEEEIATDEVDEYMNIFENYYNQFLSRKKRKIVEKEIASSSVKILSICNLLNEELALQQKIIVIIKLLEILRLEGKLSSLSKEFVEIVADSLRLPKEDFYNILDFIFEPKNNFNGKDSFLVITSKDVANKNISKLHIEGFQDEIYFLHIKATNLIIFYIDGNSEIFLNQKLLKPFRIYVLPYGYALRIGRLHSIYYSDVLSNLTLEKSKVKIVFEAENISYVFPDKNIGIRPMSFVERNGRLVGIMGTSGSGKTTLLNVLNGTFKPTNGHVYVNGIDLHENLDKLKGLIGYVSQEDMLIEELTVFQNLYFNAKLCLAGKSNFAIIKRVVEVLKKLNIYHIKDLKVGTVLNRKISGGQRKRLNIALELIRETPILFLDEPTSGLSSRDSENILDLLKTLTLDGKLIFVVIHQPSSYIFKMFDRLLVLDQGGYLVYNGKPIESILYFKSAIREADWKDTVCPTCGNVNPEQIFDIIETPVINEYGFATPTRKFPPDLWYEKFKIYEETYGKKKSYLVRKLPEIDFKVPSKIKQFWYFTQRDFLSKVSSLQYLLTNLLETPFMALVLSYIIRYWSYEKGDKYILFYNENIPVFIFMSVIVAIFVGLTVSAEELFRDKKIIKREKYLNLSRLSYLFSKSFILFGISLYQSFIYVLISTTIIGMSFMFLPFWLMLFNVWFSANIMGLIISELFDNSASIYITIPFLVIPQLILTGVLVPFNKLNPKISNQVSIPWYGEILQARWAYEGLAVYYFKENPYNKLLYDYDKLIAQADYIKQYWCKILITKLDEVYRFKNIPEKKQVCLDNLELIRNELNSKHFWIKRSPPKFNVNDITFENLNRRSLFDSVEKYILSIQKYYRDLANNVSSLKDDFIISLQNKNPDTLYNLKLKYHNEKMESYILGDRLSDQYIIFKNKIYCFYKPVYQEPENKFFKAIYYSPTKPFFNKQIHTFYFNLIVIFSITILEFIILYFQIIIKIVNFVEKLKKKITKLTKK